MNQNTTTQVDIQTQPFLAGQGAGIKVDRAVMRGGFGLVSGWFSGGINMNLQNSKKHVLFARPDVSSAHFKDVKGFLAIVALDEKAEKLSTQVMFDGKVFQSEIAFTKQQEELDVFLAEHAPRLMHIAHEVFRDPDWFKMLYNVIPVTHSESFAGYLEQAKAVPGLGVSTLGWLVAKGKGNVWLASEQGYTRNCTDVLRFPRPDISDAFLADYGTRAEMGGFFCAMEGNIQPGQRVSLMVESGGQLFKIHEVVCEKAPSSPIGYAQWAFGLPVPDASFMQRMAKHDGPFLAKLTEKFSAGQEKPEPTDTWVRGSMPEKPKVSVIVPLYKRIDFIEHQLISFRNDPDWKNGVAELIYVIDDSGLLERLKADSYFWHQFHGIPMKFVFGGRNRGFSGANNLGAAVARGKYLLMLNSDVFPEENGWMTRMVNVLEKQPQCGIVGVRLLYPTGAIQHLGMEFRYSGQYDVWLNEHDGIGLPPPEGLPEVMSMKAVTGACFMISTDDYRTIGGFDEGYLIGDFEDSDICLKVRKLGKDIQCITNTNLVHLERQSLKFISGEIGFRQKVVLFNAWRHHNKWNDTIKTIHAQHK